MEDLTEEQSLLVIRLCDPGRMGHYLRFLCTHPGADLTELMDGVPAERSRGAVLAGLRQLGDLGIIEVAEARRRGSQRYQVNQRRLHEVFTNQWRDLFGTEPTPWNEPDDPEQIHPAGISNDRALEIALQALNRTGTP